MKKIVFAAAVICLLGSENVLAQENELNSGFGMGAQLVQYQRDFGVGLNFTSPLFAHNSIGIRLKGNIMYNENVVNGSSRWMQYGNLSLGVIGIAGRVNDAIRLYGEGGMIVLFPSSQFSTETVSMGGYGLFGFEFFFSRFGNYFIEIGGIGTGTVADKIATQPIYSNGMSLSTVFRFFLK